MTITFICGSLETGRDGVGDYTRMLAVQLIKGGHSVSAIALNDQYISHKSEDTQSLDEADLSVYRVSSSWSSSRRIHQAKMWLEEINPDWVSLQFVIYSFHPKGLPFGLGSRIAELVRNRRLHVMFHEIWVGFASISPAKHQVLGFFQKRIIKRLLKITKPDLITTTNGLYQAVLAGQRIKASILPLFSNISIAAPDDAFISECYKAVNIVATERDQWRVMGFFGSLYPNASLDKALAEAMKSNKEKKKIALVGFGRNDPGGMKEFNRLKDKYAGQISFYHFGELPPEKISQLLQIVDIGISCTPQQHLGKSGVFAAMKHHRLEVSTPNGSIIQEYDQVIKNYYDEMVRRPSEEWGVSHISQRFLYLLN